MSEAWGRLGDAQYVSVATFRRDGREVRTPVWVAGDAGRLYLFSEGDAGKVKRIRATKRVAVAPCDVRGGLKGDFRPGVGRVVDDAETIARGYRALRRKYGWQMTLLDLFSRLAGKIDKRALLELEARDEELSDEGT
jgi:PPOX class probable F420-dependent enzyme